MSSSVVPFFRVRTFHGGDQKGLRVHPSCNECGMEVFLTSGKGA